MRGCALDRATARRDLKAIDERINEARVRSAQRSMPRSLRATSYGGTAPEQVRMQINARARRVGNEHMTKRLDIHRFVSALALSACGSRAPLWRRPKAPSLPVAPHGAQPKAPNSQSNCWNCQALAAPERSVELAPSLRSRAKTTPLTFRPSNPHPHGPFRTQGRRASTPRMFRCQRIADEVGTPVYVYSRATLERHAQRVSRWALG